MTYDTERTTVLRPAIRVVCVLAVLLAVLLTTSAPAAAQSCTMNVTGNAYYQAGYKVGLGCTWSAVPGAAKYIVHHSRSNYCGSATVITETTGTSSGSGAHLNCNSSYCYAKSCTVYAVDSSGAVLNCGSDDICDTGCSSGSCSPCDADNVCESGESHSQCVDCICDPAEHCQSHSDCGAVGVCSGGFCECY